MLPTFKYMSPALTELRRLVGMGPTGVVHDGSMVLRWMWTKCKVQVGANDEIRPDSQRSFGNIQGVVSLAMALNRAIAVEVADAPGWGAA